MTPGCQMILVCELVPERIWFLSISIVWGMVGATTFGNVGSLC
jgi:hypothetical protein